MKHLNNNLLCAVAITTTGPTPGTHDIVQYAVVPLNNRLDVDSGIPLFNADIKMHNMIIESSYVLNVGKIKEISQRGAKIDVVIDAFDVWFDSLNLKHGKQIMPLCYNWIYVKGFLNAMFGHNLTDTYFSKDYRDLLPIALYCNDRAYWHTEKYPYNKQKLSYLASTLDVDYSAYYDYLREADAVRQIYKKMLANDISIGG